MIFAAFLPVMKPLRLLMMMMMMSSVAHANAGAKAKKARTPSAHAKVKAKAAAMQAETKVRTNAHRAGTWEPGALVKLKTQERRQDSAARIRSDVKSLRANKAVKAKLSKRAKHIETRTKKLETAQAKAEARGRKRGSFFTKIGRARRKISKASRVKAKRLLKLVKISKGQLARANRAMDKIESASQKLRGSLRDRLQNRQSIKAKGKGDAERVMSRLGEEAKAMEQATADNIRSMVVEWAAEHHESYKQVQETREAIKATKCASGACSTQADKAYRSMSQAKSAVEDAKMYKNVDAIDSLLGSGGFGSTIQALNSLNASNAVATANQRMKGMNIQIKILNERHEAYSQKLSAIGKTTTTKKSSNPRMSSHLMLMEHVDLALDLTRMQSGLLDMAQGFAQIGRLDKNASGIQRAMQNTRKMADGLKKTHRQLKTNLSKLDAESARIVGIVVKDILQN